MVKWGELLMKDEELSHPKASFSIHKQNHHNICFENGNDVRKLREL
jgi:hypothetical protein